MKIDPCIYFRGIAGVALLLLYSEVVCQINLSNEYPLIGEEVVITVSNDELELLVTYRPNSAISQMDTLKRESPTAEFYWDPVSAGVVNLSSGDISKNVSVRFEKVSTGGILVMLIAGIILLGGATFSLIAMMRKKSIEELSKELEHRPDT
jgi:hypothetical protein